MKKLKILQLFTRLNLLRYLCFSFCFFLLFSFCSADSWYNYTINGIWNSSFSATDYNLNFFINSPYSLNQLDEICFQGRILYSNISNGIAVVSLGDGKYFYSDGVYLLTGNSEFSTYCYTFSNPLKFESYQKIYYGLHNNNQSTSFDFSSYDSRGILRQQVYLLNGGTSPSSYMTGVYYNIGKQNKYYIGCYVPNSIWSIETVLYGFSYSEVSTPKFKVNYGSTSYEYDLSDNLEIRLNSPVLKDGDNYSYDGSTGINLFYNGVSQRYNKSELYLFTPSWYSNNIFTPICL